MKLSILALLFATQVLADTVTFQFNGAPAVTSVSGIASPTVTPGDSGFDASLYFGFASTSIWESFKVAQQFTVLQAADFTISTDASAYLSGGGCSHGWCPGMDLEVDVGAAIGGVGSVAFSDTNSSGAAYATLNASGSGSDTFFLQPGSYTLYQSVYVFASDAGVWSDISLHSGVTLVDPPAVPEPRWIGVLAIAVLGFVALAWRGRRKITA